MRTATTIEASGATWPQADSSAGEFACEAEKLGLDI